MALTLTADEKRTVLAVFDDLMHLPYSEVNRFVGSLTIQDMQKLYSKLKYEGYCEQHHIKYEDMTADDYEAAYFEEYEI